MLLPSPSRSPTYPFSVERLAAAAIAATQDVRRIKGWAHVNGQWMLMDVRGRLSLMGMPCAKSGRLGGLGAGWRLTVGERRRLPHAALPEVSGQLAGAVQFKANKAVSGVLKV